MFIGAAVLLFLRKPTILVCIDFAYARSMNAHLHRYFALRHGQSFANLEGIISSNPDVGTVTHGLTTSGRVQARVAATQVIEVSVIGS
jgi:hypothetical protein